jgi:hypothetical protein
VSQLAEATPLRAGLSQPGAVDRAWMLISPQSLPVGDRRLLLV